MTGSWNFPSNNFGTLTGIGEAGIETFKGSPYSSLAREICQNSMDARVNINEPVVIEFSSFFIKSKDIPDYDNLHNAVSLCLKFWTEQANKKTIDFFNNAKSIIESETISVLRISDYNTTGLQGSNKEYNTPWHNLVRAAGVSGKEGSAGGSFGIGKSAPFVCSEIRTLFYATKDIDGLSAFQGIARLVSFKDKELLDANKDIITTGTGYYSSDKRNNPLRECYSIDSNYIRKENGTDIFVLGFKRGTDWKSEIITSILEEFLIAIYNGELVVKIDDTEITAQNLAETVYSYKETAKMAYNYYQVLTDSNSLITEYNFSDLGTIELRVLVKQGLHRKIMMCRKNGMKIFDKANISSTIQFAGICILKDKNINAYFREMENPQHNAWEPERHTDKNKAKSNMSMLYRFVKNYVIEIGKKTTVDEIDADGMGEYFADTENTDTENQNKNEAISSLTNNIEINVSKLQEEHIGYESVLDGSKMLQEKYDDEKYDESYGNTGYKDRSDDRHNLIHTGTGFGIGDGENLGINGIGDNAYPSYTDDFDDDESKATCIGTMSVRLFLSDRDNNVYKLIFIPQKSSGNCFLQISLSGEQKNVKASVISAVDLTSAVPLRCKDNKIYLSNVEQKSKNKIAFRLEYTDACSLEVKLYGYS